MPIYLYKCEQCGETQEQLRRVTQHNNYPVCCGTVTRQVITAPHVVADIQPYKSMVTGEMITSRRQHRNHLVKHDVIEVGNEVSTMLKPRPRVKLSNENRKRAIAERLNR